MKRLFFIFLFATTLLANSFSQVFNTSATLKPGKFSFGFEPGVYIWGSDADPYIYLYGGAGLVSGVDFGLKLGVGETDPYVGGDVEFTIGRYFSLTAGAHVWHYFGLDIIPLFTFPVAKGVKVFTGADSDIIFADDARLALWLPIGVDINIKGNMYFVFEADINLTDNRPHYIGAGLNFVF